MAEALTGFALYAALCEQAYRRAYIKDHADQPLAIVGDGGDATGAGDQISGQALVDPARLGITGVADTTNPIAAGRFIVNNNYIYDVSNGFVAMVTPGLRGHTVTPRNTNAGANPQRRLLHGTKPH